MEWLYYLLEANLYLLLFYGFYRLLLQNETFYNSNRYYLLLSSITAFILPVLQLGFLKPTLVIDDIAFPPPVLYTEAEMAKIAATPVTETVDYSTYLYPIYLFVAFCFALKLGFSLFKITKAWLNSKKTTIGKITLIDFESQKTAFSFFNLLFIHPHLAEKETVLNHEMVHIKQKHSLDILFFEILQIICWFNPIIYFIKKDIKLLHEYIADELSTNTGMHKHEYAMFLIENSFGVIPTPLTNQIFNQSILKRRINMLNKKRTAKWARLRLLLALPMATGMLCVSTLAFTKDYGYVDLLPEKASLQKPVEEISDEVQLAKKGRYSPSYVFDENNKYKSLDKRLIVVNGVVVKDNNKYYGNRDADNIVFLKPKNAIDKYGVKGKYGAVEVYGKSLTFQSEYVITDTAKFPAPVLKQDKIKFPPPMVKPDQTKFYPRHIYSVKTNKMVSVDKRYIVINGAPISDNSKFYGVINTAAISFLNPTTALKKYGKKAQFGAVEIKGNEIKHLDQNSVQSPPPSQDQKFPPPIIRKDKTSFYPMRSIDKKGNVNSLDSRIIVINGKKIENIETFFGVTNASNVVDIDAATAIKKYGKGAKYGAVEIKGNNLKYVKSIADGPPPPVMEQVKFPPPTVKPDKATSLTPNLNPSKPKLKNPPAVEAPPASYKGNDQTSSSKKNKIAENVKRNQEVVAPINSKPAYVKSDDVNVYPTRINISNVLDRSNGKKLIVPSKLSENKSISIFDRNGNKLFGDSNYTDDWAGYEGNLNGFDGKLLKLDTYYYMVAIKGANGKTNFTKGWFTII